ncbi:18400_t:CDS:2 [Funneliformis geosporum]|nr:18400_t:CDS:2 [Funneliformis geosporum]
MTSNTLEFYSNIFAKDTKTFLQLITNITSYLTKRDNFQKTLLNK